MGDAQSFYDSFAQEYNSFVNWAERLRVELPFLLNELQRVSARLVLDVAGATGEHALALAQSGFEVYLADISPAMLEQARRSSQERSIPLHIYQAGFGELRQTFDTQFDALLCLGNSIPHVLDQTALQRTAADMAAVVKPGGLMIWQLRNFEHVLARQERYMEPQSGGTAQSEWLFIRFYDFILPYIRFNMLRLHRNPGRPWQQYPEQTLLYPWTCAQVLPLLVAEGWNQPVLYGNLQGEPYAADGSSDLVLVTTRRAE